jgi:hypothetical protein
MLEGIDNLRWGLCLPGLTGGFQQGRGSGISGGRQYHKIERMLADLLRFSRSQQVRATLTRVPYVKNQGSGEF